jgi:hypothetical protein
MTCNKLVRGVTVAVLAPAFGEPVLLVPFEHREATDVGEITVAASVSDKRRLTPCQSRDARELSLNAHVSRSVVEKSDNFRRSKLKRMVRG